MTTLKLSSRNFGTQMNRLYKSVQNGEILSITIESKKMPHIPRSPKYREAMMQYKNGDIISMDTDHIDTKEKFLTFISENAKKI